MLNQLPLRILGELAFPIPWAASCSVSGRMSAIEMPSIWTSSSTAYFDFGIPNYSTRCFPGSMIDRSSVQFQQPCSLFHEGGAVHLLPFRPWSALLPIMFRNASSQRRQRQSTPATSRSFPQRTKPVRQIVLRPKKLVAAAFRDSLTVQGRHGCTDAQQQRNSGAAKRPGMRVRP